MGPKLHKITLSNYRSFVEKSSFTFPESGLMSLNGKNLDTGGGSGSGKSNFITAIAFALGFSPLAFTEFQSWYSEKSPLIELELDTDLGPVRIVRGKTLKLWVDGVEVEGSVAQKETKIDEIFGMNAEFRKLLTYRGQDQPGAFLSNTDSKKKEFLMQVLGLDPFETALDTSSKNIVKLESSVNTAKATKEFLENTLCNLTTDESPLEDMLVDLEGHKSNILDDNKNIAELKVQLSELHKSIEKETNGILVENHILHQDALDRVQELENEPFVTDVDRTELNRLAKMVTACKERLDALSEEDREKRSGQNIEVRKLQGLVDIENAKLAQVPALEKQYQKLQLEITKLEAGRCSMCDREWDEALAKKPLLIVEQESILDKMLETKKCKGIISQLQAQMEPFRSFEPNPKIAQMTQAKSNLESQHATEKQKIDSSKTVYLHEKNAKIANLKAIASSILADGEKEARLWRESRWPETEVIGTKITALTNWVTKEQEQLNDLQKRISRAQYAEEQRKLYEPKLSEAVEQLVAYESELRAEQDFLSLIGREGFLGSIFDEILVEISDEVNGMLGNVANVRHVTIDFKSESLTQKGVINRTIIPVVTVGGNTTTIKSGLSGGMLSVVELATDLAVGKVIATRTGIGLPFLVLDEALDGLGVVEKESALELIQNYAQDRLVIMTEHATETKGLFSKQICIEYSNGRSIVV